MSNPNKLAGIAVVRGGFFSLEGGVTIAIPATLFAWIAGTSLAMVGEGRSVGPQSTI